MCAMLDWCLRSVLPWFLEQLAADYAASGKTRGKRAVNVTQVAGRYWPGVRGSCLRAWRSRRWSGGEDVRMREERASRGERGAAKLDSIVNRLVYPV